LNHWSSAREVIIAFKKFYNVKVVGDGFGAYSGSVGIFKSIFPFSFDKIFLFLIILKKQKNIFWTFHKPNEKVK